MDFRYHKWVVAGLLLVETVFLLWPVLEMKTGLYAVMGLVYIGVTSWFVFGECRWWLYQYAGIAYVVLIISTMMAAGYQIPLPRFWYFPDTWCWVYTCSWSGMSRRRAVRRRGVHRSAPIPID